MTVEDLTPEQLQRIIAAMKRDERFYHTAVKHEYKHAITGESLGYMSATEAREYARSRRWQYTNMIPL